MLRKLLSPKQYQSSVDFFERLASRDNIVLEFEPQTAEKTSEPLRVAIIFEHAPMRITESLRLSGPDVRDNYPAMRDAMRCLYESTREYPDTQTYGQSDVVPMDVSVVR